MGSMRYLVYFTPLVDSDNNVYGDEIDVTDRIELEGLSDIKRSIDSDDYDIGVFAFADLNLKGYNFNGYFNDEFDLRSIFPVGRDRCKVRVVFQEIEMVKNSQGTVLSETIINENTFRGTINEEATRLDIVSESITFKVLSRDSVLRTTQISGGVVENGMLASSALFSILNQPKITSILTVLEANINPDFDFVIDLGSDFDNSPVSDKLNELLLATNSVMLIDDDGVVTIRSREENIDKDVVNLYGKNDEQGRENIVDITSYNAGKHRTFTSVVVNATEEQNSAFALAYGFRQKKIDFGFITNPDTEAQIAARLVDEFKFPKTELNVKISTKIARDIELLDRVSVNYPLRVKPFEGTFLPVIGVTKIGETDQPLPWVFGAIGIDARVAFKVTEITDNPKEFTSILKLRQTGKSFNDGYYDGETIAVVGFAILGIGVIGLQGNPCDNFNPSSIGSAKISCTRVA